MLYLYATEIFKIFNSDKNAEHCRTSEDLIRNNSKKTDFLIS
jgi:hypothetical protein